MFDPFDYPEPPLDAEFYPEPSEDDEWDTLRNDRDELLCAHGLFSEDCEDCQEGVAALEAWQEGN